MYEAHANYVEKGIPYPVNLMRNVALRFITTPHVMIVDVDLVPSPNIGEVFERSRLHVEALEPSSTVMIAFVVPGVFDVPFSLPLSRVL
jgi:N-acetyllactosaminide beta-1,3-N-acetylglucosaminyltransferase